MTDISQGTSGTLTAQFTSAGTGAPEDLDSVTITILNATTGATVLAATAVGIVHLATGLYSYTWAVGASQAVGPYAVVWSGLLGATAASADEVVTVVTGQDANHWYTDLATLKAAVAITDSSRDTLLQAAISAASRWIDNTCGRFFWLTDTATARTIDPRNKVWHRADGNALQVPDIGSLTDLAVEEGTARDVLTWSTVASNLYVVQPADALDYGRPITELLKVYNVWTWTADGRVRVTARWGWPAVPDEIAQAALIMAARIFKRKDSPEGIMGAAEWGGIRLTRTDPDVAALIAPFKIPGMA